MSRRPAINWLSLALALGAAGPPVLANCVGPESAAVDLRVQRCRVISLAVSPSLRPLFTGALITDSEGLAWTYPSAAADPCSPFPPGRSVRKLASFSCCDTGTWGKCLLGGRFLADLGGPPVQAFQ